MGPAGARNNDTTTNISTNRQNEQTKASPTNQRTTNDAATQQLTRRNELSNERRYSPSTYERPYDHGHNVAKTIAVEATR